MMKNLSVATYCRQSVSTDEALPRHAPVVVRRRGRVAEPQQRAIRNVNARSPPSAVSCTQTRAPLHTRSPLHVAPLLHMQPAVPIEPAAQLGVLGAPGRTGMPLPLGHAATSAPLYSLHLFGHVWNGAPGAGRLSDRLTGWA